MVVVFSLDIERKADGFGNAKPFCGWTLGPSKACVEGGSWPTY